MKRFLSAAVLLAGLSFLYADVYVPFFGGASGGIDLSTVFAADFANGSTGLSSDLGCDLWFEFTPYSNLGITPRSDRLSVSLKMSNAAVYAWRGYTFNNDGASNVNDKGTVDQAKSIYFGTLTADLKYGDWWVRAAGIDPDITMDQVSIRSMLDNVIKERTGDKNQYFRLPLLRIGGPYSDVKTTSVIGRDLVHIDRKEVQIYGMYSAGYSGLDVQADIKVGSWKNGSSNDDNSWVFGADVAWEPTLVSKLTLNTLYAVNYPEYSENEGSDVSRDTISSDDEYNTAAVTNALGAFPDEDTAALASAPLGIGLGYEHNLKVGSGNLKPYAGIDFVWDSWWHDDSDSVWDQIDFEIGGGIMWLWRGTGASFKRDTKIGGMQLSGDTACQVGFGAGVNVNKDGVVNAILSFNENPEASPIKNLGGFFQVELMNLTGRDYTAADGETYSDTLVAFIAQLEYRVNRAVMPYIFGWFVPSVNYGAEYTGDDGGTYYSRYAYNNYNDDPTYSTDVFTLTTKAGVRLTPFDHAYFDIWYERSDQKTEDGDFSLDSGMLSVKFGVKL